MQKDYPGMVFACTSMSDTTITMVHKPPLEQEIQVDVPFADLGKWKVTRCHMAKVCPAPTVEPLLPQNVPYCQEERLRLQATLALHEAHDKHQVNHLQVAFVTSPTGLYTLQPLKKANVLKLVPIGTVSKAKESPPKGAILMDFGGLTWQIQGWKQFQSFEDASPKPNDTLVPYFWCKATKEDSNMEFGHVNLSTNYGTLKVPVLTNSKAVEANQVLLYQKVDDDTTEATETTEGATPSKKKKAKR